MAFEDAFDEMGSAPGRSLETDKRVVQRKPEWHLTLFFREVNADGKPSEGNMIKAEQSHVNVVRQTEKEIEALPGYEDFCYRTSSGKCRRPMSLTNFVYGKVEPTDWTTVSKMLQPVGTADEPLDVGMVSSMLGEAGGTWYFDQTFAKDLAQNRQEKRSTVLRSRYYFGVPLNGYDSREDRYEEQREKFEGWITNVVLPYVENASRGNVQVLYRQEIMREEEIRKVVFGDGAMAIGAFIFIVCVSAKQMGSLAIPLAGVTTISLSLPFAFAVFRLFYDRFAVINVVALYLTLGIGADNLYVFESYWRTFSQKKPVQRLAATIHSGGRAIFVASVTTAFSVLANCMSPIYPVKTFGAFMDFASSAISCLRLPYSRPY
jgi:hypothetical protein